MLCIGLYLGKILVWMFTVHAEHVPHNRQRKRSWWKIWRIPVFEEVRNQDENKKKQEEPLEVETEQKVIQPHLGELNQQRQDD